MPYDPSYHCLWNVPALRALIAHERPDVLQASSPYLAAFIAATQPDVGVRALVLHSDQIGSYARPVLSRWLGANRADLALRPLWAGLRSMASRFDRTIVSACWLAEQLRVAGVPRVAKAPFGIERASLSPSLRDEALRAALLGPHASDPRARLVAVVGRLALEKRAALVFDALAEVAKTLPVAVVVMGDGPERARLEARARTLGLSVTFTGFITDRERYARTLASADALIHGCAVETFGFSVAEALASGTPAVVPSAGGAGELVDETCGVTYDPAASPVEAALAIKRLLHQPPGALSAGAVARAALIPSASSHFDDLFMIYEDALRSPR